MDFSLSHQEIAAATSSEIGRLSLIVYGISNACRNHWVRTWAHYVTTAQPKLGDLVLPYEAYLRNVCDLSDEQIAWADSEADAHNNYRLAISYDAIYRHTKNFVRSAATPTNYAGIVFRIWYMANEIMECRNGGDIASASIECMDHTAWIVDELGNYVAEDLATASR